MYIVYAWIRTMAIWPIHILYVMLCPVYPFLYCMGQAVIKLLMCLHVRVCVCAYVCEWGTKTHCENCLPIHTILLPCIATERIIYAIERSHILQFSPLFSFSAIICFLYFALRSWFMSKYVWTTYKMNGFIFVGFLILAGLLIVKFQIFGQFTSGVTRKSLSLIRMEMKETSAVLFSVNSTSMENFGEQSEPIWCGFHVPVCKECMHIPHTHDYKSKCHFRSHLLRYTINSI